MTGSLSNSLAHVAALHDRARPGFAAPMAGVLGGDPYFVDLPAFGGGMGGTITESALRVLAALYFTAEVEGTYMMSVAEELTRARFTLNLTDREAASRLEELARAMQDDWIDRNLRNQIFARVFGLGHADPQLGAQMVNHEFEPQFARLCLALQSAHGTPSPWGPPAGNAARVAAAMQTLLSGLAPKVQGNTLLVSERLSRQLQMSIAALDHPGLTSLFMGRTAWDVIRGVLGPDTPDLLVQVNRAQTGMRILSWAADNLAALRSIGGGADQAIRSEPQLLGWADIWLEASGIAAPQPHTQYGAWAS